MNIQVLDKNNKYEINLVKKFLKSFELIYDENTDYTISIFDDDKIIATMSKEQNILKCIAINKDYQGYGLMNKLLTTMQNKLILENYESHMVFTKIENREIFKSLSYTEIASTDEVILLEYGTYNIDIYLEDLIKKYNIDVLEKKAMIVMNCNPFTKGHQYLIETAAKENKKLIIFILEEDKSYFSFKDRFNMVKEGTKHLENVLVLPSSKYIISSATFPSYFIKEKNKQLEQYVKLDSQIIITKFCKKLNICKRYLGSEELCELTLEYNKYIEKEFPKHNIEVKIIKRKQYNGENISASTVRKLIKQNEFDKLLNFVPQTTLDYIMGGYKLNDK